MTVNYFKNGLFMQSHSDGGDLNKVSATFLSKCLNYMVSNNYDYFTYWLNNFRCFVFNSSNFTEQKIEKTLGHCSKKVETFNRLNKIING